jgi:hypothetical protein
VPHAFGGALALAYYAEPRATIDIDLNLFVPAHEFPKVAARLTKLGVAADAPAVAELVQRDGQARVFWDHTPIDMFFAYDEFHDAARKGTQTLPFADTTIPILAAEHLTVCKVVFNRGRDWVDIEAIVSGDAPIDVAEVLRWVARIAGDTDPRYERITALLSNRHR